MPVPAKRKSRSRARKGRSHLALKKISLTKCGQCGRAVKPHCACSFCGIYRGRPVIKIKIKEKKEKR